MKRVAIGTIIATSFFIAIIGCDSLELGEKTVHHYGDPYPGVKARAFHPLPVGAVQPEGWLKKSLQAWADGITGHLHEYRSDTFANTWDNRRHRNRNRKEAHQGVWWPFEQQGYWIDGIVQTAYILDEERLKDIADRFINGVLDQQNPDGYMGMTPDDPYINSGDIYVTSELTLGLMSYYSATGDSRIIPSMQKGFRHILENSKPLTGKKGQLEFGWQYSDYGGGPDVVWGRGIVNPAWEGTGWPFSGHIIEAVLWVYAKTGDPKMKELADVIYDAIQQVPSAFQTEHLLLDEDILYDIHAVDVTETLRIPALYYLYSGNPDDLRATIKGIESVNKHHGQVHGGPAAMREPLSEKGALIYTENCVHTTWSYTKQLMFSITGNVKYADDVEQILFNVGPGSSTADRKAIQYMTAPNQVAITKNLPDYPNRIFSPDGNPMVQCCVGESTRLYPNFIKNAMWLASPDNGLAAACYGPSQVSAKVGRNGKVVKIAEKTNYPFEENIRFVITSSESVKFPLYLRIPGWSKQASIKINGELYAESLRPDRMVKIDRRWAQGDEIELHLPMRVSFVRGDKSSVSVVRGPLVYALKIAHDWKQVDERFPGFPDWEVRPGSPWNYALSLELDDPAIILRTQVPDSYFTVRYPHVPEGSSPWEAAPIELVGKGKKVDGWEIMPKDRTPDVPQSPVINNNPLEDITLVPYGTTRIRITYFPVAPIQWEEQ